MENYTIDLSQVSTDNVVNSEHYQDYVTYANEFRHDVEIINSVKQSIPDNLKAEQNAFKRALNKVPPIRIKAQADKLIAEQQLKEKYFNLINNAANKNYSSYTEFNQHWNDQIWSDLQDNSTKKVSISNRIYDGFDIDFMIAENLQHLYSEEDPRAEYYQWIEDQQKIEIAINTNGTTEEEVAERESFISFMDDRETEIKRIIFLYSGAAFNPNSRQQKEAQEKLKFLTFKLSELRRLKDRTSNLKSVADTKENNYLDNKEEQVYHQEEVRQKEIKEQERKEQEIKKEQELISQVAQKIFTTSLVNQFAKNLDKQHLDLLEDRLAQKMIEFHPVSNTCAEAKEKIDITRRNGKITKDTIDNLRGISRGTHHTPSVETSRIKYDINRFNGFTRQLYEEKQQIRA